MHSLNGPFNSPPSWMHGPYEQWNAHNKLAADSSYSISEKMSQISLIRHLNPRISADVPNQIWEMTQNDANLPLHFTQNLRIFQADFMPDVVTS